MEVSVRVRIILSLLLFKAVILSLLLFMEVIRLKLERDFQKHVIDILKSNGCMVMKLDSGYIQGIPDLLVLSGNKWATLECKKDLYSSHQPNQDYYVDLMNNMSFSRFICPENEAEVFTDLFFFLQHGK